MSHNFVVCIPYFGGLDAGHAEMVGELRRRDVPIISCHGNPYVDHARATLAARALEESDAEIIFWIDHDILFQPDDVFETVERALASPYDVVGVCYPTKIIKGSIVGTPAVGVKSAPFYTNQVIDARNVGFGFTAVKRSAFLKVAESLPYVKCASTNRMVWPFFGHIIRDGVYLGEDYSFCELAKEAGLRIGIYLRPRLIHKGSYGFILEDNVESVPRRDVLDVTFLEEEKAAE